MKKLLPLLFASSCLVLSSCSTSAVLDRNGAKKRLLAIKDHVNEDSFVFPKKMRRHNEYVDESGNQFFDIVQSEEGYTSINEKDESIKTSTTHHNEMYYYILDGNYYEATISSSGKNFSKTPLTKENETAIRSRFLFDKSGVIEQLDIFSFLLDSFDSKAPAKEAYFSEKEGNLSMDYTLEGNSPAVYQITYQNYLLTTYQFEQGDSRMTARYDWGEGEIVYPDLTAFEEISA